MTFSVLYCLSGVLENGREGEGSFSWHVGLLRKKDWQAKSPNPCVLRLPKPIHTKVQSNAFLRSSKAIPIIFQYPALLIALSWSRIGSMSSHPFSSCRIFRTRPTRLDPTNNMQWGRTWIQSTMIAKDLYGIQYPWRWEMREFNFEIPPGSSLGSWLILISTPVQFMHI